MANCFNLRNYYHVRTVPYHFAFVKVLFYINDIIIWTYSPHTGPNSPHTRPIFNSKVDFKGSNSPADGAQKVEVEFFFAVS